MAEKKKKTKKDKKWIQSAIKRPGTFTAKAKKKGITTAQLQANVEKNPDDFLGFSIGSGITYKRCVYDIAYQYRFGRGVRTATVGNQDSSQDVDQHTVYMSLIYHF